MTIKKFLARIKKVSINYLLVTIYIKLRGFKYRLLSNCKNVKGKPVAKIPVVASGLGHISFGNNVMLGVENSPFFFNSYIYLEARNINSKIVFEDNVWINNNISMISDGEGITIKSNVLIGTNCNIYDSDFHDLNIYRRASGKALTGHVLINKNVFIGSNVTILKGVEIGENSVIANGAVVTKSIPSNVIAGGVPCKILRKLNSKEMQLENN